MEIRPPAPQLDSWVITMGTMGSDRCDRFLWNSATTRAIIMEYKVATKDRLGDKTKLGYSKEYLNEYGVWSHALTSFSGTYYLSMSYLESF